MPAEPSTGVSDIMRAPYSQGGVHNNVVTTALRKQSECNPPKFDGACQLFTYGSYGRTITYARKMSRTVLHILRGGDS